MKSRGLINKSLIIELGVILTSLCVSSQADDWPNWRGPNYNGISYETGWVATMPKDGTKVLWQASVGTGFSSIVVSNGRCYTMGNRDRNTVTEAQAEKGPAPNICGACSPPTRSTDKGQQLDIVYCFDAETGKEIWRHIYPSPLEPKGYEGGPSATPTVADGKVYTISKDGKVFCLDASTGDVIWGENTMNALVERPQWGFSGSPLVLDDKVFLNVSTWGLALNKDTGRLIWQNGKRPAGYATAVPYTMDNQKCIAIFGCKGVKGVVAGVWCPGRSAISIHRQEGWPIFAHQSV